MLWVNSLRNIEIRDITPLTKEEIGSIDTLAAKYLLLNELCQIPEFMRLWNKTRLEMKPVMKIIGSCVKERFSALSPDAKDALLKSPETTVIAPGENAFFEAWEFIRYLRHVQKILNEEFNDINLKINYMANIKAIVEPLGIPDFSDDILLWDMQFWGLDRILYDSFDKYSNDVLESQILREITELGPVELGMTKPSRVQKRATQKVATLREHHSRYRLRHRIRLWVRNVVHGESIRDIASGLQDDLQRVENKSYDHDQWIREQIRDASRILGVKRPPGRPRKGGVLRHWKLMVK